METFTIIFATLIFFTTSCVASPTPSEIEFYFDSNYQGSFFSFSVRSGCHNLVGIQNDVVSSVNTKGSCFVLYEHTNCQGKKEKIFPNSESRLDLGKVGLNDVVSSFEPCP